MANLSLADFSAFLNHYLQTQEKIDDCLSRLESLIFCSSALYDHLDCRTEIADQYLKTMLGLVRETITTHQDNLHKLYSHYAMLMV